MRGYNLRAVCHGAGTVYRHHHIAIDEVVHVLTVCIDPLFMYKDFLQTFIGRKPVSKIKSKANMDK